MNPYRISVPARRVGDWPRPWWETIALMGWDPFAAGQEDEVLRANVDGVAARVD